MPELKSTDIIHTPVLFLIFNRPEATKKVFDAIRKAKPPRLYIASDGPREERTGEKEKVAMARNIVQEIDWPCELYTMFREQNMGLRAAVSSAITWFFEHEKQGIILEDDCLPHKDFFRFCEVLLDKYKNNEEIFSITGSNFQKGRKWGHHSYYFSKYPHIWGWATWQRAWQHYDPEFGFWPDFKESIEWNKGFSNFLIRKYHERIFNRVYKAKRNVWSAIWRATIWYNNGLVATPNVNLISNIGFGPDATHTFNMTNDRAALPTFPMHEIIHPEYPRLNKKADFFIELSLVLRQIRLPWTVKKHILKLFNI